MEVVIDIQQITKRFGGLVAINSVDLKLYDGEILGLIGPNGAGKSTIFNLITNLHPPDSGRIIINGVEHRRHKPDEICRLGVGRTFQIVKPFGNLNVLQNVMVGSFCHRQSEKEVRERALQVLEFVGLYDKKDSLPFDLPIASLKRLELARTLATEPTILLLDEVMAGLNPTETEHLMNLVRKINESGCTLLVIEHVMQAIMNISDRIAVLHLGQKLLEGSPREVVSDPRVIKAYLGVDYATT